MADQVVLFPHPNLPLRYRNYDDALDRVNAISPYITVGTVVVENPEYKKSAYEEVLFTGSYPLIINYDPACPPS